MNVRLFQSTGVQVSTTVFCAWGHFRSEGTSSESLFLGILVFRTQTKRTGRSGYRYCTSPSVPTTRPSPQRSVGSLGFESLVIRECSPSSVQTEVGTFLCDGNDMSSYVFKQETRSPIVVETEGFDQWHIFFRSCFRRSRKRSFHTFLHFLGIFWQRVVERSGVLVGRSTLSGWTIKYLSLTLRVLWNHWKGFSVQNLYLKFESRLKFRIR